MAGRVEKRPRLPGRLGSLALCSFLTPVEQSSPILKCMGRIIACFLLLGSQAAFSQATGIWERRAPYPVASTEVSGAAIDGLVYIVCGLTPQGSSNRLHRYDPRTDTWLERASVPIEGGADHCNVAAAGGKLYLLGAMRIGSAFIEGNSWEYDSAQNRWKSGGRMNNPGGGSAAGVAGTDSDE